MIQRLELWTDSEHDLSRLARGGTGKDSSIWIGIVLFVIIEGAVVLSLVTSYFYYRVMATAGWPPPDFPLPDLVRPAVATGVLTASTSGIAWANRSAARERRGATRAGLAFSALLMLVYLVLSGLDIADLTFSWASHVYGSLVWTLNGYQYFHAASLFGLSIAMLAFGWNERFHGPRRAPLQAVLIYWVFVAISSIVTYATVYVSPHIV